MPGGCTPLKNTVGKSPEERQNDMKWAAKIAMISWGVLLVSSAASAQSNCKEARGRVSEVFTGGNTSGGPLTNGGWLDGTVLFVYGSDVYPTPDSSKITFGSTFTLTNHRGELKGKVVWLFDFGTGQSTGMVNIDPAGSTGSFAGATGLLFLNVVKATVGPPPNYYIDMVAGQLCFAR